MKSPVKTAFTALAASSLLVGTVGSGVVYAQDVAEAPSAGALDAMESAETAGELGDLVLQSTVEGAFAFTQGDLTCNSTISHIFRIMSAAACGSTFLEQAPSAAGEASVLEVTGAVEQSFSASLEELIAEDPAEVTMGCSCAGDTVDGAAHANAHVSGVLVRSLLEKAGVVDEANTIVFTSTDGFEVALPLDYVTQRFSVIVDTINNEPMREVLGSSNQLWLGSTSARYFSRDIVKIELQIRDEAPAVPDAAAEGLQVPHVSLVKATPAA